MAPADFRRDGGEAVRPYIAGKRSSLVEQDALTDMAKDIRNGPGRESPFRFVSLAGGGKAG